MSDVVTNLVQRVVNWHYDSFNRQTRYIEAGRYISPNVLWTSNIPEAVFEGIDGYLHFTQLWNRAFPDARIHIVQQHVSEYLVTSSLRVMAIHTGTLQIMDGPIPPTGRVIDLQMREMLEVRGGKIARGNLNFNPDDLLYQLGFN